MAIATSQGARAAFLEGEPPACAVAALPQDVGAPSPLKSPVPLICQLGPGLNEPAIPAPAAPVAANASKMEQGRSSII